MVSPSRSSVGWRLPLVRPGPPTSQSIQARIFHSKAVHQGRVGYEWKTGRLSPYVEAGLGVSVPDGGDNETFKALEVGTKLKVTDKFSAYGKWENIFQDSDDTRDWKVEVGTKYKF